jgi:uncharacterized membrane protein YkoI
MTHAGTIALAAGLVAGLIPGFLPGGGGKKEEPRLPKHVGKALAALEVLGADLVAPAAAVATAEKDSKGKAVEVGLEVVAGEKGRSVVWEVEVLEGAVIHRVRVDAKSGAIVSKSDVQEKDDAKEIPVYQARLAKATTGLEAALKGLSAKSPGLLVEADLDDEKGTPEWEIKLLHEGALGKTGIAAAAAAPDAVKKKGEEDEEEGDEEDDGD